jgi:signal recognition particle subunit SEC65
MITLKDDIENLDRMVDGDTPKDKIRSQIRLIAREVAVLEADYATLAQAHQELHAGLEEKIAKLQERDKQALRQWFREQAQKQAEFMKRHSLTYDA